MSTTNTSWRGKAGGADCLEIWEPLTPANLRTYPGLYRCCFTFTADADDLFDAQVCKNWQISNLHLFFLRFIYTCLKRTLSDDFISAYVPGRMCDLPEQIQIMVAFKPRCFYTAKISGKKMWCPVFVLLQLCTWNHSCIREHCPVIYRLFSVNVSDITSKFHTIACL